MAHRKRQGRAEQREGSEAGDAASLHERVTLKIVEQLREGTPPWVKP